MLGLILTYTMMERYVHGEINSMICLQELYPKADKITCFVMPIDAESFNVGLILKRSLCYLRKSESQPYLSKLQLNYLLVCSFH